MIGPKRLALRIRNVTRSTWQSLKNYKILSSGYGQMMSMRKQLSVDQNGDPVPWFTYPAIEYLKQLDLSGKRVFEYGSGYSTLFWAKHCAEVIAIEDDQVWYNRLKPQMPSNVKHVWVNNKEEYLASIAKEEGQFDIIVNDGVYRLEAARLAQPRLKDDGFIVLDNAEWCPNTSAYYREQDLIEVDMYGLGPINTYAWTTSFYFTRKVKLKPKNATQPSPGVGAIEMSEDIAKWVQDTPRAG